MKSHYLSPAFNKSLRLGMVVYICNLSTQEVEARESGAQAQIELHFLYVCVQCLDGTQGLTTHARQAIYHGAIYPVLLSVLFHLFLSITPFPAHAVLLWAFFFFITTLSRCNFHLQLAVRIQYKDF
jgi:hypothetical protein